MPALRSQGVKTLALTNFSNLRLITVKSLAKKGNIETKMFLSRVTLAARQAYVAEPDLTSWAQENVFESGKKHSCLIKANFTSETYFSQFSQRGNV